MVLTIGAAYLYLSRQQSIYRAQMSFVVSQTGGVIAPVYGDQSIMQTMANLAESDIVSRTVIRQMQLDTTPEKLQKHLKASFSPDSSVLGLRLDWPDKAAAVPILSNVSAVFKRQVDLKLGAKSNGEAETKPTDQPVIHVTPFDPPYLKPNRVSPKPVTTLGFAAGLGLALGLIFAFLRDGLDERIRSRRQAEEWFGSPVIGALPKGTRRRPPLAKDGALGKRSALLDAVQMLRVNLQLAQQAGVRGSTALVVTSAGAGEGKTTVTANLAIALALAGQDVICVDADLRRPTLHRYLETTSNGAGLAEVIEGKAQIDQALKTVHVPVFNREPAPALPGGSTSNGHVAEADGRLRVLTTTQSIARPDAMLTAHAVADLVANLREEADFVIFDSPPVLMMADAAALASEGDSVLVVAREGKTARGKAEAVRSTFERLGIENVNVVLTDSGSVGDYGYA
jgi:Mrp family chromosome partitioning ATPase